jgi:NhaA family Na+:H+ antiporter
MLRCTALLVSLALGSAYLTPAFGPSLAPLRVRSSLRSPRLARISAPPVAAAADARTDEQPPTSLRRVAPLPKWLHSAHELQQRGAASLALILATVVSLTLSNLQSTSAPWLRLWSAPLGPAIGGHALSVRGWINEGLMAVFFFVVGLEIKMELRLGSLASVKKAVLPCIAALGGMLTPMACYLGVARLLYPGSTLAGLTIPMATDIAFAMAIYGFFRDRMPPSASAFLLTLATVDDLGAILVLATCFASHVSLPFLGGAAAVTAALAALGRRRLSDLRVFGAGGLGIWYCLLRSGVNADIAGVLAALCLSTQTRVQPISASAHSEAPSEALPAATSPPAERLVSRAVSRLEPLTSFVVMPLFALANTAVQSTSHFT